MTLAAPPPASPRRSQRGFSLFGVPVTVSKWWLLLFVALTYLAWPTTYETLPGQPLLAVWVSLFFPLMLFFSVLIHELAHAAAGQAMGMPPSRIVFSLLGGHTSFENRAPSPVAMAVTAGVGPLSNAILALGAYWLLDVPSTVIGQNLLASVMITNAMVAGLNALPGMPLDGGQVLAAVVWRITGDYYRGIQLASVGGILTGVGVVLLGVATLTGVVALPTMTGMWGVFIGWVVASAAWQSFQGGTAARRAERVTAHDAMRPAASVPLTSPVTAAAGWTAKKRDVLVTSGGLVVGLVTLEAVAQCPAKDHLSTNVEAVMMSLPSHKPLPVTMRGVAISAEISRIGGQAWGVCDGEGKIIGVIYARDVFGSRG